MDKEKNTFKFYNSSKSAKINNTKARNLFDKENMDPLMD